MNTNKGKNICFLFGAGISIPAGFPTTQNITDEIFNFKDVFNNSIGTYSRGKYPLLHLKDEYAPRIDSFLGLLKKEIDKYYSYWKERRTNYEDLYYIAKQIEDSESEEYDNPAVQPLADKIELKMKSLLKKRKNEFKKWLIPEIAREATIYIHSELWRLLSKLPDNLDHLNCLINACKESNISKVNIFSLNHDLVLEKVLEENKIEYVDGFGEMIDDIRYWKPEILENDKNKLTLLKLHGSVNLWRFNSEKDSLIGLYYGDVNKCKNLPPFLPILLIGTFNKMYSYSNGMFFILQWHVYRLLSESNVLIVSGYSFGDKGINMRIVEWLYSLEKNKIILIHPEPDFLKRNSRGAILHSWRDLLKNNKLHIIKKNIENTSWTEIKDSIFH